MALRRVCVFCGSSAGNALGFRAAAEELAREMAARHRPRLRRRLRWADGPSGRRDACGRRPCDRGHPRRFDRPGDCTSWSSRSTRRPFDARTRVGSLCDPTRQRWLGGPKANRPDGGFVGCVCRAAGRFRHLRRVVRGHYLDSARSASQPVRCVERRRALRSAAGAVRWRGARRLHPEGRPARSCSPRPISTNCSTGWRSRSSGLSPPGCARLGKRRARHKAQDPNHTAQHEPCDLSRVTCALGLVPTAGQVRKRGRGRTLVFGVFRPILVEMQRVRALLSLGAEERVSHGNQ